MTRITGHTEDSSLLYAGFSVLVSIGGSLVTAVRRKKCDADDVGAAGLGCQAIHIWTI